MDLNIKGYTPSPHLLRGSANAQAVATGNSITEATLNRNAATGGYKRRRTRKYNIYGGDAGYIETNKINNPTSSYPTLYSPVDTQHKLLSTIVANKVNSIGDAGLSKGGKKRKRKNKTKKRKYKLRR